MFKLGKISLRERALSDRIFWKIIQTIEHHTDSLKYIPKELTKIKVALSDIYYANFSIFQSLPDAWAIGHLFPVLPIHRLNEKPTRNAILADITCDCDGRLDRFIDRHGIKNYLRLHQMNDKDPYYLGVFLVGAYQETLGDLHNLLGDTNVFSIRISENEKYSVVKEIEGDTVADVLSYVEYNPKRMLKRMRQTAEKAIDAKFITPQDRRQFMLKYEEGLRGYPYFVK
jgi:arginine decarboxylase